MNSPENASPVSPFVAWFRRISLLLMSIGGAGFVAAVAWWFMFFEQILGIDVKIASECFYRTTLECQAGNFAGSFMEKAPYEPMFMWAVVAVAIIGFLVRIFTPEP